MRDQPTSEGHKSSEDPMVHDHVSEADLDESLQMLKTRVGQVNAVFACFGSAAQHAQHFEAALGEFLSDYNKLAKREVSEQGFEALDQKLQKKTLGTLLREFSKYVTIQDPNIVAFLELALGKRNFLMHHFFREREGKLRLEGERMELLSELTSIDHLLDQAATLTRAMRIAMSETISGHQRVIYRSERKVRRFLQQQSRCRMIHNRPTPNQAMERTADRCTLHFEMTSILPLRATRALLRRRSSCTR